MRYTIIIILLCFGTLQAQNDKKIKLDTNYLYGRAELKNRNYENALKLLEKALSQKEDDIKLLMFTAEAAYNNFEFSKSIKILKKANRIKKGIADFQLAKCYAMKNMHKKAVEHLKIHLGSKYRKSISEIKLDSAFRKTEKTAEWINMWKKKWHNSFEIRLNEAVYSKKYKRNNEALEILDEIITNNKNTKKAYYLRAKILEERGQIKQALKDMNKAVEKDKRNINYIKYRAELLQKTNKLKKSIKDYNLLIKLDPYNIDYYKDRAIIAEKTDETDLAISDIEIYRSYYKNDSYTSYLKGLCMIKKNDLHTALKCLNKAIEGKRIRAEYFNKRAEIYEKTGVNRYAKNDYSMSLDLNPRQADVFFNRAKIYIKEYDYKNACSDFKRAYEMGLMEADDYIRRYCREK